jgi:hypothetical protein
MNDLNLDIRWTGDYPASRCSAATVQLPFRLYAEMAVIYEGQNDSGVAEFAYRVEVYDHADQYGITAPVVTKYIHGYLTHMRAQLEATSWMLDWFGRVPLGFSPDVYDGVICKDAHLGRR